MWVWDGTTLKQTTPNNPFTSSSVEFERVRDKRMALAAAMPHKPQVKDLINYHQSHQPNRGFMSVCMHRADAKSVSLSHVSVGPCWVDFKYKNGLPCADIALTDVRVARRSR